MYQIFPARRQTGRRKRGEGRERGRGLCCFGFCFSFGFGFDRFHRRLAQNFGKFSTRLISQASSEKLSKFCFLLRERDRDAKLRKRERESGEEMEREKKVEIQRLPAFLTVI